MQQQHVPLVEFRKRVDRERQPSEKTEWVVRKAHKDYLVADSAANDAYAALKRGSSEMIRLEQETQNAGGRKGPANEGPAWEEHAPVHIRILAAKVRAAHHAKQHYKAAKRAHCQNCVVHAKVLFKDAIFALEKVNSLHVTAHEIAERRSAWQALRLAGVVTAVMEWTQELVSAINEMMGLMRTVCNDFCQRAERDVSRKGDPVWHRLDKDSRALYRSFASSAVIKQAMRLSNMGMEEEYDPDEDIDMFSCDSLETMLDLNPHLDAAEREGVCFEFSYGPYQDETISYFGAFYAHCPAETFLTMSPTMRSRARASPIGAMYWRALGAVVRARAIVVFWMGEAAKTACAPGGPGREADAAAFANEFDPTTVAATTRVQLPTLCEAYRMMYAKHAHLLHRIKIDGFDAIADYRELRFYHYGHYCKECG